MCIKRYLGIMVVFAMVFLVACSSKTQEPRLILESNNEQLQVIHYGDLYNKSEEDIEKRLKEYMIGRKFEELPVIATDQEIIIINTNFDVNTYEIQDLILDTKANIISGLDSEGTLVNVLEDDSAFFQVEDILGAENYEDRVDGKSIHCLLIKSKIEKSEFKFATLILVSE